MSEISIIVGTVYGNALNIARKVEKLLKYQEHTVKLFDTFTSIDLSTYLSKLILIISSTTGKGQLPDNIELFFDLINNNQKLCFGLKYSVIALGNSRYEHFCGGGKKIDQLLQNCYAIRVLEMFMIDASNQFKMKYTLKQWIDNFIKLSL